MSYALFTADGGAPLSVLSLRLVLPVRGAWWAEIELDTTLDEMPSVYAQGRLVLPGRVWTGYILRVREWHGRTRLFFEAGANGMRSVLGAQQFESALLSTVVQQVIVEAGEVVAPGSAILTDVLEYYHRARGSAGALLSALLDQVGLTWRFTDAGTVWWGPETWPASSEDGAIELEPWGDTGETEVELLSPTLSPGHTFGGRRVERVEYRISEEEPLSARLTFTRPRGEGGGLRAALSAAVRAVVPELPYLPRYPARVASQRADGRLELVPDDTGAVGGSPPVPPLYGLPGVTCEVPEGARVGLVHDAGDARRPRAAGWESGTPADIIRIDVATLLQLSGGEAAVHRVGDHGSAGTFSVGGPGVLVYTDPDNNPRWTMTLTSAAPGSPVALVITPISDNNVGVLVTKATEGAEKVKA